MDRENRYLFKFYVNARHSIEGDQSDIHPHTWEISVVVVNPARDLQNSQQVERDIESYLDQFESKWLNELTPFNVLSPTLENMGKVFFKEISKRLSPKRLVIDSLEISENPTRTYIVTEYESYFQDMRKQVEEGLAEYRKNLGSPTQGVNSACEESSAPLMTESMVSSPPMLAEPIRLSRKERRKTQKSKRFEKVLMGTGSFVIVATMLGLLIAKHMFS